MRVSNFKITVLCDLPHQLSISAKRAEGVNRVNTGLLTPDPEPFPVPRLPPDRLVFDSQIVSAAGSRRPSAAPAARALTGVTDRPRPGARPPGSHPRRCNAREPAGVSPYVCASPQE